MLGIFRTHDSAPALADNQAAVGTDRFARSANFHGAGGAGGGELTEASEVLDGMACPGRKR